MSPSAAKVALGRKTSGVAMGTDVEGTVFTIVTCTMTPKTLGQSGSGATSDRDIKEASRSREDRTIVTKLYHERTVCVHSIFV